MIIFLYDKKIVTVNKIKWVFKRYGVKTSLSKWNWYTFFRITVSNIFSMYDHQISNINICMPQQKQRVSEMYIMKTNWNLWRPKQLHATVRPADKNKFKINSINLFKFNFVSPGANKWNKYSAAAAAAQLTRYIKTALRIILS